MDQSKEPVSWKILMVDDDKDDYFLVRTMLTDAKRGKCIVDWANAYEAGLKALMNAPYDAVLVDYDLGLSNGLELIRDATANGIQSPFILFTGHGSYEVDQEALRAGATLYLTKGETSALLLERGIRYAIERKQIEVALQQRSKELEAARAEAENEKLRLEAIMEALPVGVAITDALGGNVRTNSAYEQVWGEPRPDPESVSDYDAFQAWWGLSGEAIKPEEWASAQAVLQDRIVTGQLLQILRFNGLRAYVLNSAAPVHDVEGKIVGSAVAIQDVTSLWEAEEELRKTSEALKERNLAIEKSEQKYALLFERSSIAVALTKLPENIFTDVNEAFEKLFGYTKQEVVGKTSLELGIARPEERAVTVAEMELKGDQRGVEKHVRTKSGEDRIVILNVGCLEINDQRYAISTMQDITERKRAEEKLRATNEELALFNEAMIGRELRMIELKREVNRLCAQAGQPPRYEVDSGEGQG